MPANHGRRRCDRYFHRGRESVADWSFHHATAAVMALLLQRMGFVVERSSAPHERNFERLREGAIVMLAP
ncbi:glycine betaine ABC transporter substrate-binding protein [Pseudomonas sp. NFIX28]|uniref:glycine betaine ABC transporter substrate-binding protein n=1 Tax=Pseudomonas sp. NFIX28 TaxID=1566235 RepID=UPI003531CCDA